MWQHGQQDLIGHCCNVEGYKKLCYVLSVSMSLSQVRKAYGNDMQGMEAHEEMARMREHVLTEVGVRG